MKSVHLLNYGSCTQKCYEYKRFPQIKIKAPEPALKVLERTQNTFYCHYDGFSQAFAIDVQVVRFSISDSR